MFWSSLDLLLILVLLSFQRIGDAFKAFFCYYIFYSLKDLLLVLFAYSFCTPPFLASVGTWMTRFCVLWTNQLGEGGDGGGVQSAVGAITSQLTNQLFVATTDGRVASSGVWRDERKSAWAQKAFCRIFWPFKNQIWNSKIFLFTLTSWAHPWELTSNHDQRRRHALLSCSLCRGTVYCCYILLNSIHYSLVLEQIIQSCCLNNGHYFKPQTLPDRLCNSATSNQITAL